MVEFFYRCHATQNCSSFAVLSYLVWKNWIMDGFWEKIKKEIVHHLKE